MENHVRARRAALGLTQAELAERLGVSRQTVISIERGRFDPSLPLAFRLSALLGAPIEELFVPSHHDVRVDPL
ncbi:MULTISPECIES: helix-turn-helix transcriptional regulator [Oerskovia]|uniref:Helix-turn-helix transcriptional regulator n=1 Tax=Oerskovia merdavium TaxID=2762227 RepID=A0ABR8TU68_9CELL|nr:helix-turn-helix transcriptional regulator [Oerskovia merdavium]MBD7979316.1 helix-turn-helix transcriptional regulator [Oerskovia merdavium]